MSNTRNSGRGSPWSLRLYFPALAFYKDDRDSSDPVVRKETTAALVHWLLGPSTSRYVKEPLVWEISLLSSR